MEAYFANHINARVFAASGWSRDGDSPPLLAVALPSNSVGVYTHEVCRAELVLIKVADVPIESGGTRNSTILSPPACSGTAPRCS